jgi:hypothetical protein
LQAQGIQAQMAKVRFHIASNVLLTVKPGIKVEGTDNYVFLQNIQVFELN